MFADFIGSRPMGMERALSYCNIPLAGTHHRGADDAYNIARVYRHVVMKTSKETVWRDK
jgi:inhibitor of KinA sporulation pathway (predicted exonuclease)